jgi:hypothetical protein
VSQELYEKRLGHVERDVAEMRGRLTGVESKLGDVSDGVQQLLRRDAEHRAAQPASVKDMLQMAVSGAVLLGLCVSAIVYVASGHYSADIAVMKYKLDQLASRGWSTVVTRGK